MISQLMFLNKILTTKDFNIVTLNEIDDQYFSGYRSEFNFIKNHVATYGTVPDKLAFLNVFPDFDIQEVNEPDNYLIDKLQDDYYTECAAKLFNETKRKVESGEGGRQTFLELKKKILEMEPKDSINCVDITRDTSRYNRYLERTSDLSKYYYSTGFSELDQIIGGIDKENENMVIAARTGVGKTYTMVKIAASCFKQGLTVGIFEGEMTEDKIGYRIDTLLSYMNNPYNSVSNKAINRGFIEENNKYKAYIEGLKCPHKGAIKILTPNNAGGKVTVNTLRSFIMKENLDILFVDQYSLLEDTSHAKASFERVGNIAKEIKQLQVEFKIPIIAVSQMNRTKNEDGSQDTTQIGLSDMIPQYATVLIMLDKKEDAFTLNIVKARDGGDNRKLDYNINFDSGKFTYIPNEKDGISSEKDCQDLADRYNSSIADDSPF